MSAATVAVTEAPRPWLSVLWDLGAFVLGLSTAWSRHWQAADLVWSLWLSSLVVGYTSMMWTIGRMTLSGARSATSTDRSATPAIGVAAVALFFLGFFTIHFGMFHFVHSAFLNAFFPIDGKGGLPNLHTYATVFRRYWVFLPATFVAERAIFANAPSAGATQNSFAQTVASTGPSMVEPYKNVVRMHLLIFFFMAAWALKLDNFAVVAVVYVVYFFPWWTLKR